jgi:tetratricopeptide (TPR) repeat protein
MLEQGAAESAVRMLRNVWEPELPARHRVPLYCLWIRGLCELQQLDHARTLAERAAAEFPRDLEVQIALGNVLDLQGDLPGAKAAFERAIELDPTLPLPHYNLGAVLERLPPSSSPAAPDATSGAADPEGEAEACYRRALELDPAGPMLEASTALGALLRRQGRLDEAAEVYDAYLDADPLHVDLLVEHGICLSDLDELDAAVERFELALAIDKSHASALYNLAVTYYRMRRAGPALATMERARSADPRNPLTLAVLGAWRMAAATSDAEREIALALLHGAVETLCRVDADEGVIPAYGSLVVEEVFESLWHHDHGADAREVARIAGQRDWITAHMLATLNAADHGSAAEVMSFTARVEAHADAALAHWPRDADGYTSVLTVVAADEGEARRLVLEYLRTIEAGGSEGAIGSSVAPMLDPSPRRAPSEAASEGARAPADAVEFRVHIVRDLPPPSAPHEPRTSEATSEAASDVSERSEARPRGVAEVQAGRTFTFRS